MRVAVAGATGRIGSRTVAALERDGHEVVRLSRSGGVDVHSGAGLDDALAGVAAVIDTISYEGLDEAEVVDFFGTTTRRLLDAEQRAGVRHHVALSIVGVHRVTGNPHYAGKRAQEAAIEAGDVPWTIVPATQFHDFADLVTTWSERDGSATIAPLLVQPIAPDDVAAVLAEIAVGAPQGRYRDVAGPRTEDLVDLARRTRAARGAPIELVPTWDGGIFDVELAGTVMLPGTDARIAPTTFDAWLKREFTGAGSTPGSA